MLTENTVNDAAGKSVMESAHWTDTDGISDGGQAYGPGYAISWQRQALGHQDSGEEGPEIRRYRNGALATDVLEAVCDRLVYINSLHRTKAITMAIRDIRQAIGRLQAADTVAVVKPETPTPA